MKCLFFCSLLFFSLLFSSVLPYDEVDSEDSVFSDFDMAKEEVTQNFSKFEMRLSAECEPISTIANCVNVISGDFFQIDRDIEVNGFEPIHFTRFHDSGRPFISIYGGYFGSHLPLMASNRNSPHEGHSHWRALISEREGFPLLLKGDDKDFKINPLILEKGYTNLGQVDLHNTKARFSKHNGEYRWRVSLGDGTERLYEKPIHANRFADNDCFTKVAYAFSEETRPNGTQLIVETEIQDNCVCPKRLRTFTKSGIQLNELNFIYSKHKVEIISDRGDRTVYYQSPQEKNEKIRILDQVKSSQKAPIQYHYSVKKSYGQRIKRVERPEGRCLDIHYDDYGRVTSLHSPIGCLYRFDYDKGRRLVLDGLKQLTIYDIHNNRLESIKECDKEDEICRQQRFFWNDSRGTLKAKALCSKNFQHCRHVTTYDYDNRGNMTRESFFGNLTGKAQDIFSIDIQKPGHKLPHLPKEAESYTRIYQYSDDGFNLLLSESTPEGFETHYSYANNSNRLKSRLVSYEGQIQERLFHHYDEHGIITLTVEDDGSSTHRDSLDHVTTRHLKIIQPVYSAGPSFGKPAQIQEFYWDIPTQQNILLKTITFHYNGRGLSLAEHHHDAHGQYRFTLSFGYDGRDRIISKTNALGHTTHYAYDENDNLIKEKLIGSGKKMRYQYDAMNRLIAKTTIHQEGEEFQETFEYDLLGRKIASTDIYGRRSEFKYDRLGRLKKEISPSFRGLTPTIKKGYKIPDYTASHRGLKQTIKGGSELLDLPTSETNPNGHTTKKSYNAYGQPTHIIYPDGSEETLKYTRNGWLKHHCFADHKISYTHDAKGRVLIEQNFDLHGNLLKQQEWHYKGPHLIAKKNGRGIVTTYRYDGASRLIEEHVADQVIQFVYDSLGRLQSKIQLLNGTEKQIESYGYDLLDQLTSKTLHDQNSKISSHESYAYDIQGNRIETILLQDANTPATTKTRYHSGGWLLSKTDPIGNTLSIIYDHSYQEEGQRLLRTVSTDPIGRQLIQVYDPYDHLIRQELYASQLIHAIDYSYDAAGNKIRETHRTDREYTIHWSYDFRNKITSITEGPKTTRFNYNILGQLQQKIKPDGIPIDYQYDLLGRMTLLTAPGISYHYQYDLNDNCIASLDAINQLHQIRTYDAYDQLVTEELSPGNRIEYRRDLLNRITTLVLPDGSTIDYQHDPLSLTGITRTQLTYTNIQFDWSNHRIDYRLPNTQPVDIQYDLLGRPITISTPFWNQTLDQFDPLGNLIKATINGKPTTYTYDAQNQLTSENQISYRFDALYNRLETVGQTFTYNSLNQIENLPHDANGNLGLYSYDALDRVSQLNGKNLIYDPFDRLIRIDALDLIYLDKEEIGALRQGQLCQLKVIDPSDNTVYAIENEGHSYSVLQQHGNIVALVEGDNTLFSRNYSAFTPSEYSMVPWGFSGKREIDELIYFGFRFYSPSLGRWITPDPLSFGDGPNLYAYLKNNPFTHFDPYGLEGVSWSDSSREFGKNFCGSFGNSLIDPIGACVNCNNDLSGAALCGNLAGRAAGICCSLAMCEYALANAAVGYGSKYLVNSKLHGMGRSLYNRMMGDSLYSLGSEVVAQNRAALSETKMVDSNFKMMDVTSNTRIELNRFHQAANNLSKVGQNNIRTLRGWAKSKGWERFPNNGGPEKWGNKHNDQWNLIIKPEASCRSGLQSSSNMPRFDARLEQGQYINPFTGQIGGKEIGTHIPLGRPY